jgi:hypothetical protein
MRVGEIFSLGGSCGGHCDHDDGGHHFRFGRHDCKSHCDHCDGHRDFNGSSLLSIRIGGSSSRY